jgi:hypothetical protein
MKYLRFIFLFVAILIVAFSFLFINGYFQPREFHDQRTKILSEMNSTLEEAVLAGDYKCCIEPPCKMCFLGNWVFEDGKCDCDTLIAQGKWDEVCPECKHGIEEGICKSEIETRTLDN